ncbi:MAG: hypothetical protein DMG99_11840 [Acidobacteria bacterium]|nr:MAG: hypothetical protein DMG99_11840 [Acidobacteriota bacterium]
MHIIADPRDENVLYIMDVDAYKSTDGGHLFNKVHVPHGDNHGLWIDPQNTKRMIASNDGGVTITAAKTGRRKIISPRRSSIT